MSVTSQHRWRSRAASSRPRQCRHDTRPVDMEGLHQRGASSRHDVGGGNAGMGSLGTPARTAPGPSLRCYPRENSCVCGLRCRNRSALPVTLPLSRKTLSPLVMSLS
jgi:hypothetical protein